MAIVLLLILPFNIFLFPTRHEFLSRVSGREDVVIDVWFAYTPEKVYDLLPSLGQQGRMLYAVTELSLDILYPILYSTLLWLLMELFFSRLLPAINRLMQLKKLPAFLFSMDILENFCISALLLSYPMRLDWLAWAASVFSSVKFILGVLGLGILAIAGLAVAWKTLRMQAKG